MSMWKCRHRGYKDISRGIKRNRESPAAVPEPLQGLPPKRKGIRICGQGGKETGQCAGENAFSGRPGLGKRKTSGAPAELGSVRLPAKSIKSVFVRKPRSRKRKKPARPPAPKFAYACPQSHRIQFSYANPGRKKKDGPGAGAVWCTPARKAKDRFRTQTRAGKKKKDGQAPAPFGVRLPAKPKKSVFVRKPRAAKEKRRPWGRRIARCWAPCCRLPGSDRRRQPSDFHRRRDLCQSHAQYGGLWTEFPGGFLL